MRKLKICSTCSKEKEFSLFQIRKASKDGYTAACKACLSIYDKERANRPNRVEARINYAKTTDGKLAGVKAKTKWRDENLAKRSVHVIVGNAVRDGKIVKPNCCSVCLKEGRLHGHHDDYAYPLSVRWLCSPCHRNWHKINGECADSSVLTNSSLNVVQVNNLNF